MGSSEHKFDFLGYTFTAPSQDRRGEVLCGFPTGDEPKSAKKIRATVRGWNLSRNKNVDSWTPLPRRSTRRCGVGSSTTVGIYRSRACKSCVISTTPLQVGAMRKYKRFRGHWLRAHGWDESRTQSEVCLSCGASASDRRLDGKSRMRREPHVRFREGVGVQFPRATRLVVLCRTAEDAQQALAVVQRWTVAAGLRLHPEKRISWTCRSPAALTFSGITSRGTIGCRAGRVCGSSKMRCVGRRAARTGTASRSSSRT